MIISRDYITREEIIRRLRNTLSEGLPIIGAGAGIGLSAKMEEAGGADLIVVYNSGWYRMSGRPSMSGLLSFGDANSKVIEMAPEILPVVKDTPVLAGVLAHDTYIFMDRHLQELKDLGFSGIQNFPGYGGFEGVHANELEEIGYSMKNEVELVRLAHSMDMFTSPYVFSSQELEQMIEAGADAVVIHCGCTMGGESGIKTDIQWSMKEATKYIQEMTDLARKLRPDIFVLCHGGPIAEPEDVEYVLANTTGVDGFYGASSMERLPVERAIKEQVAKFKSIPLKKS